MNEPMRLRDGSGAARALMAGSTLQVPLESRRRAVAFTSAAAAMGASATAVAAGTTTLLKSFVLCVALGAAGGGVMSLVASETVARLDRVETRTPPAVRAAPAAGVAKVTPPLASVPAPVAAPAQIAAPVLEAPAEVRGAAEAPSGVQPSSKDAAGNGRALARALASSGAAPTPVADPQPRRASLFEQQRIIESARAAVARGDLRSALALLDDYEHGYTSKQFGPEALALRIDTLQKLGQLAAARALAADFAQRYPHHPLLARVQASVEKK